MELMGSCVTYTIVSYDAKQYRVVYDPVDVLGRLNCGEDLSASMNKLTKDLLDTKSTRQVFVNLFNNIEDTYLWEWKQYSTEDEANNMSALKELDDLKYDEFNSFIDKVVDEIGDPSEIHEIHTQVIIRCEAATDNVCFVALIAVAFDIGDYRRAERVADEVYGGKDSEYVERFKEMLAETSDYERICRDQENEPLNFYIATVDKTMDCRTGEIKTKVNYLKGPRGAQVRSLSESIYASEDKVFTVTLFV